MHKMNLSLSIAILMVAQALSFSTNTIRVVRSKDGVTGTNQKKGTRLNYKSFDDVIEVDHEAVLEAIRHATPQTATRATSRTTSRATSRPSPITSLRTIQDYQTHVINEPSKLVLIRFSAPWCKVCQVTNVAFERIASKLGKLDTPEGAERSIKFLSVNLDGKDETAELKELLQIEGVPMGVLYHPSIGMVGKVNLNRGNLSELKKRFESYLDGNVGLDMLLDGLLVRQKEPALSV